MAVDGGVGNQYTGFLGAVGAPNVVFFDVVAQVFLENGAVEGADDGNVQGGGRLQQLLHLHAVLAHDADVVPPGLAVPFVLHIQSAEFAEAVGGEEHLVGLVVGHHDLRPVHHGSKQEGQGVLAQGQGCPVLHGELLHLRGIGEELTQHDKGLGISHHRSLGITLHKGQDVGGMIRLHVLHHQIVRLPAIQHSGDVTQPFLPKTGIHRVHHGDLLIQNHIGIVSHAIGHHILALEQVNLVVIHAHIADIIGNHRNFLLYFSDTYYIENPGIFQ